MRLVDLLLRGRRTEPPDGMTCLQCKDDGPCLVLGPVPPGVIVRMEFDCGGCGRRWAWLYDGLTYTFEREVQIEV